MTAPTIAPAERDRLVVEHVSLVKATAHRLAQRLPPQVEIGDLLGGRLLGDAQPGRQLGDRDRSRNEVLEHVPVVVPHLLARCGPNVLQHPIPECGRTCLHEQDEIVVDPDRYVVATHAHKVHNRSCVSVYAQLWLCTCRPLCCRWMR